MHTTSESLLERVRRSADQEAWQRFVHLYTPLLHGWARRAGLLEHETADVLQEVFAVLVQKLPEFHYDRQQSFRAWLRTILLNKWRELHRRRIPIPIGGPDGPLGEMAAGDDDDGLDEAEYRQQLLRRALELVERDFQPATWQAWCAYAVAGRPAAEVAGELSLTVHAVYLAKARVLRRLREEVAGLLDEGGVSDLK